jgi:hypothetical protein
VNIGADQYKKIVEAAFAGAKPATEDAAGGFAYRDGYTDRPLSAADAELVIAIGQLAVDADRVDDPDERKLFDSIAGHIYNHANLATAVPMLVPVDDAELRLDHLQSHAAQLKGKPAAGIAFAIAYALVISDLLVTPEESALLEALREALGLDEDRAEELTSMIAVALTPEE